MAALTSQERKVLGFLAVMVALGLVVLGIKRMTGPAARTGIPVPAATAQADKTP